MGIFVLKCFKHPLDDDGAGNLTVGSLGDDETVGTLDDIVGDDEITTYGQTVHELTIVGP